MFEVLTKSGVIISIILLGIVLHQTGFFKDDDFHIISKICINITLPCAIITNLASSSFNVSQLFYACLGFLLALSTVAVGYFLIPCDKPRGGEHAFNMLNVSGFNVGSFGMPFAMSFLDSAGLVALSLFDSGNSIFCLGGNYSLAALVNDSENKPSIKLILGPLLSSVPFDTYAIMIILGILKIRLPEPVIAFTSQVGSANVFVAMLMIGVGFHIPDNIKEIRKIAQIICTRYAFAILLSTAVFLFAPLPLSGRQALVVAALCPVSAMLPTFTERLGGDYGLSATINSISIILSVILMTLALLIIT